MVFIISNTPAHLDDIGRANNMSATVNSLRDMQMFLVYTCSCGRAQYHDIARFGGRYGCAMLMGAHSAHPFNEGTLHIKHYLIRNLHNIKL